MNTLAVGFALVLLAVPAAAQSTADSRWTPWLGCWDLVLENAREGSVSADSPRDSSRTRPGDSIRPKVCVEPAEGGGATFRTTIGTETPIVQTLVADGIDRMITDGDCRGTQRTEWSKNGLRLYVHAELTCKDDRGPRRVSGFAMLGPNSTWTDVQSIEIGGRDSYRVRRYRRDAATTATARPVGNAITIDDVKEASGKVSSQALEAAIVETNATFPLSSQRLLELDDAKVSPNVIDLMVAVSYPKRFVVDRSSRVDRGPIPIFDDPFAIGGAFGSPIWSDSFGFYSPFYGYFSPYYYSPFAYRYWPAYDPYYPYYPYYPGGGFVITDPGGGGGGGTIPDRPTASGSGRVVDGLGYTRVRPRETEPAPAPRQGSDASSAGSSSSSGSSGSTVTSQGFSSGGSSSGGSSGGDGGGRTAQPR